MLVMLSAAIGCGGKVVVDASSSNEGSGGGGGTGGSGAFKCGDLECQAGDVCVKKVAFGETYECAKDACAPEATSCLCEGPACGEGFMCVGIVGQYVTCECPTCKN